MRSSGVFRLRLVWCVLGLAMLVTMGVVVGKLMQGQQGRQVRVKQATLALQKGRPDLALRLISPVLAANPNDLQARMLVIRTRVKMQQLRHALSHVNQLVMLNPDSHDLRRLRVDVLMSVLYAQLSNFNPQAEVLSLGTFETLYSMAVADVDEVSSMVDAHELEMIRVRLESLQVRNLHHVAASDLIDTTQQYDMLQQQLSASESKLETTLKQIVEKRPRQFDAWQMYINVLVSRDQDESLRTVANTLSGEIKLPPAIAATLIQRLVLVEDGPDDLETRLALGRRLQSAVHPRDHANPRWIRMQATLGILSGQAEESLATLDRLPQAQRFQPSVLLIRAKALSDLGRWAEVVSILQPLALKFPHIAAIQTPLGSVQAAMGHFDDAERAFRASLSVNPESAEAMEGLANVLVRQGQVDEAGRVMQPLATQYPDRLSLVSLQIQMAKVRRDDAEIKLLLERLAQHKSQSEASLMVLVDGYDNLKAYAKVEYYAQALLARNASSIVARLGLAKACLSRDEYAAALNFLEPMQVEVPDRTEIAVLIARIQLARGRFELAVDALEPVVDSQPTNREAVMLLAQCLKDMHRMAASQMVLTKFLRKRPHSAQARFMLWQLGEMSMATSGSTDTSATTPLASMALDVSSLLKITRTMIAKGELGSAKMYALLAVEKKPQGAEPRLVLADILMRMEQFDEAKSNLMIVAKDHPHWLAPYHAMLNLCLRSHQLDDGLRTASDLQQVNKTLASYLRGLLQLALGREEPAQLSLEQAFTLAIQNEDRAAIQIADTLARVYHRGGNVEKVAPMYARLYELPSLATEARLYAMDQGGEVGLSPQMAHQLSLAAKTVHPDRKDLMAALMIRLDVSHQGDQVLILLEKWIETDPQELHLRRAKAEILSKMGRAVPALAAIENALIIDPGDLQSWRLMVNVHLRDSNFPAAKRAIARMSQLDVHAAMEATLLSATLYEQAGLSHRAARVAGRAVHLELPRDSGRIFRLGQLLERYAHKDRALACFEQVAEGSTLHIAAELEAAKLMYDLGDKHAARNRLHAILSLPNTATQGAAYLLQRRTSLVLEQAWLGECDQQLRLELLPEALRHRWLMLRAELAIAGRDWPGAVAALTSMQNSGGSSPRQDAILAVLYAYLGQCSQAEAILSQSSFSAWSPFVCPNQRPVSDPELHGQSGVLLVEADWLALPYSESKFYAADIRDEVREDHKHRGLVKDKYQRLGLAQLAMHVGLANVAEDVAKGLYVAYGDSILTQSVLVDAQLLQGESAREAIDKLIESFPHSSRASIELTQRLLARQDMMSAKASLDAFLLREPKHVMGRYLQAKLYFAQGSYDLGIAMLDSLELIPHVKEDATAWGDSLTAALANDFAFVLASYDVLRLDDALAMARLAVSLAPQSAATLDTLGWVLHLRGDQLEARKYLYRAMSFAPTNVAIHEHVAAWYQSQGEDHWAGYHLEQISSDPTLIELSETFISYGPKIEEVAGLTLVTTQP